MRCFGNGPAHVFPRNDEGAIRGDAGSSGIKPNPGGKGSSSIKPEFILPEQGD